MPIVATGLEHFSFSPQEIEIYETVLTLGQPTVAEIAKAINKQRTAVYFHILRLVEKRILSEVPKKRLKTYVAVPPSELAGRLDKELTDFKSLIPTLEALQKIELSTPVIEVSDSKRGFDQVYDELSSLPEGSTFRVIEGRGALQAEMKLLTQDRWSWFFKRIIARHIVARGLFTKETQRLPNTNFNSENQALLKQRIFELRMLPEKQLPFQQLLLVYGDNMAYLFPETNLVIKIKHKGMVEATTAMFESLYQIAEPQTWA
ncbi:MAG: helix-turn-helix domain-containing protein [Candidatus Uhrbacteria bacterium]